jgi:hypothetical protein
MFLGTLNIWLGMENVDGGQIKSKVKARMQLSEATRFTRL